LVDDFCNDDQYDSHTIIIIIKVDLQSVSVVVPPYNVAGDGASESDQKKWRQFNFNKLQLESNITRNKYNSYYIHFCHVFVLHYLHNMFIGDVVSARTKKSEINILPTFAFTRACGRF
jgi:hypothetical protein